LDFVIFSTDQTLRQHVHYDKQQWCNIKLWQHYAWQLGFQLNKRTFLQIPSVFDTSGLIQQNEN